MTYEKTYDIGAHGARPT